MATHSATAPSAASDDEVLAPYAIALASFCLAGGLLLAALSFPLRWLSGQLLVALVMCYLLPLGAVMSRRHAAGLAGLAVRQYRTKETLGTMVTVVALLVGLPLLEWSRLHGGADWKDWAFGAPVLASVAAVGLAWSRATATFARWHALHIQPWEDGATDRPTRHTGFDEQTGGRVNRTREVRLMWREFAAWGLALSLALFATGLVNLGGAAPPGLLSAAMFTGYVLVGLSLIGRSALLRLLSEWRLDRMALAPSVGQSWMPTTLALTVGAAAVVGLVVLAHLLDLTHLVLAWLWTSTAGPLLYGLIDWLNHLSGAHANISGLQKAFNPGSTNGRLPPPRATPHGQPNALLWWITHVGPWVVAGLVAALVLRAYLCYRKEREAGAPWWHIFSAIWLELRRLLRALFGPVRTLAGQMAARVGAASTEEQAARRRAARRPGEMLPRELVAYLYGLALAALARLGHRRGDGQTPAEYAARVRQRLGAEGAAFDDLTSQFVRARYSPHDVPPDAVGHAEREWGTLKEALKRLKRAPRR